MTSMPTPSPGMTARRYVFKGRSRSKGGAGRPLWGEDDPLEELSDRGDRFELREAAKVTARSGLADQLPVLVHDLAPNADGGHAASQLPSLVHAEVRVAQVVGGLDGPLAIEIDDHEVPVGARLERAFARVEVEE